jgi:hypothetical protein
MKKKNWTERELEILKNEIRRKTNLELARIIGCSKCQVMYAMKTHNIKRTRQEITALWDKWAPVHAKFLSESNNKSKR